MKKAKPPNRPRWLKPKNDFVFKLLFGSNNKQSKHLLIHFLNDVFQVSENQSFSNVHLQNPHLNKQHLSDKASILDIRVQIPGDSILNIEIQLENQYNMDKRTLYYCSRIIANQLNEGDNYKKLRKTITINLLDFNYFNHHNTYHSIYHFTEKNTGIPYSDLIQLHFIEITKFKQLLQNGKIDNTDRLAKWIEFISNEDDEQWTIMASKDQKIKKAVNQLEIISQNSENRWDYEVRQKALKDITTYKEGAKDEGIKEGRAEGKLEVALKMLQQGLDVEQIAQLTGLTKAEILKLQKSLKRNQE